MSAPGDEEVEPGAAAFPFVGEGFGEGGVALVGGFIEPVDDDEEGGGSVAAIGAGFGFFERRDEEEMEQAGAGGAATGAFGVGAEGGEEAGAVFGQAGGDVEGDGGEDLGGVVALRTIEDAEVDGEDGLGVVGGEPGGEGGFPGAGVGDEAEDAGVGLGVPCGDAPGEPFAADEIGAEVVDVSGLGDGAEGGAELAHVVSEAVVGGIVDGGADGGDGGGAGGVVGGVGRGEVDALGLACCAGVFGFFRLLDEEGEDSPAVKLVEDGDFVAAGAAAGESLFGDDGDEEVGLEEGVLDFGAPVAAVANFYGVEPDIVGFERLADEGEVFEVVVVTLGEKDFHRRIVAEVGRWGEGGFYAMLGARFAWEKSKNADLFANDCNYGWIFGTFY